MQVKLITNMGESILDLYPDKAPDTVDNFLSYVKDDFYAGTIFHRVIKGFMIQGGGLDKNMKKKPTQTPIRNEANNNMSNRTGTLAMARTADPHSATAQFYINTHDNSFLDFQSETEDGWGYCVFGSVSDGMETIKTIEELTTTTREGYHDVPEEIVLLEKATLLES